MRGRNIGLVSAIVMAAALYAAPSYAQGAGGCGIQQAADAAVQRQIALLDAAKVDSSEFFNGANSCLGSNLLSSLDLSNLIPSNFDFLSGAADGLINGLIQKAQEQVCQVMNDQLQKVVGNINGKMGDFQNLMGGQLDDLLGGSGSSISSINIPDIPGIGQYNFTQASYQSGNGIDGPIMTPPGANVGTGVGGNESLPSNGTNQNSSSDPFGNIFNNGN